MSGINPGVILRVSGQEPEVGMFFHSGLSYLPVSFNS